MQVLKCHQLVNNHIDNDYGIESGITSSLSDEKIKIEINNNIKLLKTSFTLNDISKRGVIPMAVLI